MEKYAYIRVSTREQNEARQLIAMLAQVRRENIFIDKKSGGDFERAAYQALKERLRPGDLVYIKSIDRLGRNYREIIAEWRELTQERGVDIVVLDMPLLDTRVGRDLLGTFISDIVLQILSFVAENERENIRARQAEGIAAARARGVRLGRPSRPLPENFAEIYERWRRGELSGVAAARALGMPVSTFRHRAARFRDSK